MDYVVGSVAALISGDVTPNRPKLVRRALTPIKHQQSPNVTPKSEFVEDRSIFLSPTLQKKKAIVKKSPKRIFENADLDVTSENEYNTLMTSPNADKVKKHLKDDLDANVSPKSPKNKRNKSLDLSPSKHVEEIISVQMNNEKTPKKKKNKHTFPEFITEDISETNDVQETGMTPNKKSIQKLSSPIEEHNLTENLNITQVESSRKKNRKRKSQKLPEDKKLTDETINNEPSILSNKSQSISKKKNKLNKKSKSANDVNENITVESKSKSPKKSKKNFVNPNAITDKDTDSEHESDNEIESENEESNKELLDTGLAESSDEEPPEKTEKSEKPKEREPTDNEVKRTLFVGNVPFSKKLKKEMKKIFSKHGAIETLRIRTVPVKDQRFTPKLALIKNELHPERTTVNVYIKFKDASSVDQALAENNTVLNEHHLRVSRSNSTGAEHDPKLSVFVGNLPFGLEDETLRRKFESCGEIDSVRIIRDKKSNAGKGFGYVNFATKDSVELALNMKEEDLTIKNRILRVKRCTQTQQHGQKKHNFVGKNQSFKNQGKKFAPNNQGRNFSQPKGFQDKKYGGPNPKEEGAYRRIMNKRQNQEGADGPPDKRPKHLSQPFKEKKTRKEFVGMTSEKKKKHTYNKGQKKKKVLSEILTNK